MSDDPAVSVIMPVHNAEKYVGAAAQSILGQVFGDFEFIIVDDASTDGSPDILRQVDDPRVRILQNSEQLGVTRSLNRAAGQARADLIARMDADDVALPERLARQFAYLDRNPEIGVLGTRAWIVDETGRTQWKSRAYVNAHATRWQLCFGNPFVHSTVMVRRHALCQNGGYNIDLPYAQDYDLWFRISNTFEIANLPVPLLELRIHGGSVSAQRSADQEAIARHVMQSALESCLGGPISSDDTAALSDASRQRSSISNRAFFRVTQLIRATMFSSMARAPRLTDRLALRGAACDQLLDLVTAYARARPELGIFALREAGQSWPPGLLARAIAGVRTSFEIRSRRTHT